MTTPDGRKWDVQEEPHGDEPKTPTADEEAIGGSGDVKEDSEVIDEGPSEDAPRQ